MEIEDILEGDNKFKNKSMEIKIQEIKKQIEEKNKKKRQRLVIGMIILSFILIMVILKNISFGYSIKKIHYNHTNRNIKLGIPKGSFFIKNNDRSYLMRNLRSANIIENETKRYLKTLKYSSCNDTIYYYDETNHFSIINYGIKNNVLFSTLSYEIVEEDYCLIKKMEEYGNKLGFLKGFHTLNGGAIDMTKTGEYLEILFQDGYDDLKEQDSKPEIYNFKAELKAIYYKHIERIKEGKDPEMIILEDSIGRFEIKEDKLYFYRESIIESHIQIPEVSVFKLEDHKMYLIENYLSNYSEEIVLK